MWDGLFCYIPGAKSYVNHLKLLLCAEISYIKLAKKKKTQQNQNDLFPVPGGKEKK